MYAVEMSEGIRVEKIKEMGFEILARTLSLSQEALTCAEDIVAMQYLQKITAAIQNIATSIQKEDVAFILIELSALEKTLSEMELEPLFWKETSSISTANYRIFKHYFAHIRRMSQQARAYTTTRRTH
ncbi:hypothetical protein [Bacillus cereus]|uniref:hypothetical protein n=1 Tax=Bacillus cereus TaxID=1396 RepID=UPI003012E9DC